MLKAVHYDDAISNTQVYLIGFLVFKVGMCQLNINIALDFHQLPKPTRMSKKLWYHRWYREIWNNLDSVQQILIEDLGIRRETAKFDP